MVDLKEKMIDSKNQENEYLFTLISQYKSGKSEAFTKMYIHLFPNVNAYVQKITHDYHDTEDLIQDIFLALLNALRRIDPRFNIRSYVFTIAANKCKDFLRKKLRKITILPFSDIMDKFKSDITLNEYNKIELHHLQQVIEKLIQNLPEKERQVFWLHKAGGLTYEEIAVIQKCSVRNISRIMRTALSKISNRLEKIGITEEVIHEI